MTPSLAWGDEQRMLGEALAAFCAAECPDAQLRGEALAWPLAAWQPLAELGFFEAAQPGGDTGAPEVVAGMEALGRAVFPGPLCETLFACGVLDDEVREAVADGSTLAGVGVEAWIPWGGAAEVFIDRTFGPDFGGRAWLAHPGASVEPVETLAGEPWGRAELVRGRELEGVPWSHSVSELGRAAWLAGAGKRLIEDACEHARTRKQFGRPIGEFQAVAHPLADCHMRLVAAAMLARSAAHALPTGGEIDTHVAAAVAAARLSADAASLQAVATAHQVFGAVGITLEGPAFHISRRIRHQVAAARGGAEARAAVLQPFWREEGPA